MASNRIEVGSQFETSDKAELGKQAGVGNRAALCRVEILLKNDQEISFNETYVKLGIATFHCHATKK